MAKLISPRLATPSCAKPFTCPPLSLGAGANLSSPGLLCWRGANCPISPFEAPLCVNSFTSPLASSNTKQHSTLHWSFCPKLFDFQDPIYGTGFFLRPPAIKISLLRSCALVHPETEDLKGI